MTSLVAPTMGTTASIDVRDPNVGLDVLQDAVAVLTQIDERFSTYRSNSDIRRLERGELALDDAHADVHEVIAACAVLRAESDGAFDAVRGGRLDPSGYVKGWAGERAADVLRRAGAASFALNLGGDVVCAGRPTPEAEWRVGVTNPLDPSRFLAVLGICDGAVATSADYERGHHIAHGRTGEVPTTWRSITILAPDLSTADAIATAAFAMGHDGPSWAASRYGCEVGALGVDGRLWTTKGFERARVA
jgi:thiamine biosynthesis lipoprotein